jgi:NO-binding membrane sensor protein with MHYT domain/CheY-like chemotaxis protein/nitrogen-specific signal transduction histidine kinase
MLHGYYEAPLVLVSILVAIFASYTTLRLAERVTRAHGRAVHAWTGGGALAMGSGIWAMHFIGMLAFRLPIPVGYDLRDTLLSLLLPITVSGLALWQASRHELHWKRLAVSAVLMGGGINAMHYTGMAAMHMEPAIRYDPLLFALSVVIAVVASAGALWIAFRLRRGSPHVVLARAGAAVVMGFAIVGMHYTGMAAAHFAPGSVCRAATAGVSQDGLAVLVVVASLCVLTVALLASVFDARLESNARVLAASQASAAERQTLLVHEREARSHAENVSAMQDEFLATLSHELRTPLSAILGWAEILRRGARDEATLLRGLQTIERNARAQAQLVDDLLDMSRIISGKVRLDVKAIEPATFIEAALETVGPAAQAKNIELAKSLALGAGAVTGDLNRLQQVMWNLLSNAVKFTPAGGRVEVSLERSGDDIAISVRDSGIGIDPEFLPFVFDRFRQADASTTRRHGGLGLGLSIARQLVELQGGMIEVDSAGAGKGATFTLRFPLRRAAAPKPGHPSAGAEPLGAAPAELALADLTGISVLVVDDAPDTLELTRQVLASCGAATLGAASADAALALLAGERPDVLVSDIGMPDVDGLELVRRLRRTGPADGGAIPAIALTAFTRQQDREQALRAGFTAYLAKPAAPAELVATVAGLTLPKSSRAGLI